ncbi:MAG TPA: 50S ribosomal protein L6 [Candidatus Saccharimonadales bacterium]|nr:50S ribosomal protein L6 [Candidatus Saccharimonadales bacterium]
MSRVGKSPIPIPSGVTVNLTDDEITISGSKGNLKQFTMPGILVKQEGNELVVSRANDEPKIRAKHGLMRALLNNMINGVSQGFSKKLEISGVGYRVNAQGSDLKLNLGFSHDVIYKVPAGVTASIEQNTNSITVSGISRQQVGQVAAEIRALKKPEPYKGKGIKYEGERIIRKSGKSGKEK